MRCNGFNQIKPTTCATNGLTGSSMVGVEFATDSGEGAECAERITAVVKRNTTSATRLGTTTNRFIQSPISNCAGSGCSTCAIREAMSRAAIIHAATATATRRGHSAISAFISLPDLQIELIFSFIRDRVRHLAFTALRMYPLMHRQVVNCTLGKVLSIFLVRMAFGNPIKHPPICLNSQVIELLGRQIANPNRHIVSKRLFRMLRIGHRRGMIRRAVGRATIEPIDNLLVAPFLAALRHFALAVLTDHVAITIEPFRIQRSPGLHPHQRAVLVTLSGFAPPCLARRYRCSSRCTDRRDRPRACLLALACVAPCGRRIVAFVEVACRIAVLRFDALAEPQRLRRERFVECRRVRHHGPALRRIGVHAEHIQCRADLGHENMIGADASVAAIPNTDSFPLSAPMRLNLAGGEGGYQNPDVVPSLPCRQSSSRYR